MVGRMRFVTKLLHYSGSPVPSGDKPIRIMPR